MQAPAPRRKAQIRHSRTFVDTGHCHCASPGLNAANCRSAGRISLGLFLCRDEWQSKHRECAARINIREFANGRTEDQNGRRKWAAIKNVDSTFVSCANIRDDKKRRGPAIWTTGQPLDRRAGWSDERTADISRKYRRS